MKLQGAIVQLKSRVNASGDTVNTVSLEVFWKVEDLHSMMRKPLSIILEIEEKGPFA